MADKSEQQARARIIDVAQALGRQFADIADALHLELAEAIPELRGDPAIIELLRASVEGNIETFVHLTQHSIPLDGLTPAPAAIAYAQRLAQRGTSATALIRAYRLGQRRMMDISFEEIAQQEKDLTVAYHAAQLMHDMVCRYVDQVSESVVVVYESERERWLAHRTGVRATMLSTLLTEESVDIAQAEQALGYRLRQHHLGMVAWDTDRDPSANALRRLESVTTLVGNAVGSDGQPLFIPQDRSLGWAWIPLGRRSAVDVRAVQKQLAGAEKTVRVALGTVGAALPGFRATHEDAIRAHTVATIAADRAEILTSSDEPGVRAAALLTGDLPAARDLVVRALGPLNADDDTHARLRETLLVFLSEGGSYRSSGERLHVHRNTVKYRIDRAVEVRGRPLDDDRFNLELALLACRWLGRAVLT